MAASVAWCLVHTALINCNLHIHESVWLYELLLDAGAEATPQLCGPQLLLHFYGQQGQGVLQLHLEHPLGQVAGAGDREQDAPQSMQTSVCGRKKVRQQS